MLKFILKCIVMLIELFYIVAVTYTQIKRKADLTSALFYDAVLFIGIILMFV